jgi:hypothetical protein
MSDHFTLKPQETITAIFFLTRVSAAGTEPTLTLTDIGGSVPDTKATVAGLNAISFTSSFGDDYEFEFYNGAAAQWSISEFYCIRSYSPEFIRIDFHDTHDLGDIVYQSGFTQSCWLQSQLNTPTHEPVEIGEEKNGIFIAEKIITKYNHRIITYISPVFYRSLIRLPQHDTISITDEVGFVYVPAVGNIKVKPINWNWFDTGTVEISFNDNSEFIWVSDTNNLS